MSEEKTERKTVKDTLSTIVIDYFLLTVGVAVFAFAWAAMLIPNGIASGGLTGASTILNFATGIPVYLSYIVMNIFLLVLGVIVLGKGFGFKTIYAIAMSTFFLNLFGRTDSLFLFFDNKLLLVVVAGIVESIGTSIILTRGGSTGGTDIIALIINKFWPVTIGKVFFIFDLFIIASVLLVPGKTIEDMIYGYVTMIVFSQMVDWLMLGRKSTWQIMVFSEKYRDIADMIIYEKKRGVTALDSVGWYSGVEKKVLIVMVRKPELHDMTRAIRMIDPKAFVTVTSASTVYGEGFDELKTGVNLNLKDKLKNVKSKEKRS